MMKMAMMMVMISLGPFSSDCTLLRDGTGSLCRATGCHNFGVCVRLLSVCKVSKAFGYHSLFKYSSFVPVCMLWRLSGREPQGNIFTSAFDCTLRFGILYSLDATVVEH